MLRIVVLISGNGSNLQALLDATARPGADAEIVGVISNRPDAYGLQRAAQANVETAITVQTAFADRDSYDAALIKQIEHFSPDLVVLAGFMRILSDDFVQHYHGRLINIHPSLLPAYKGLNTHKRALEAGEKIHGASVHFVSEELDGGPVILQASVAIEADDTADSLAARVLEKEHLIYPLVVNWIAGGRLKMANTGPLFDGQPLTQPLQLEKL